nr:hypothetical protein [Pseudonocardia sp. ICBG601]
MYLTEAIGLLAAPRPDPGTGHHRRRWEGVRDPGRHAAAYRPGRHEIRYDRAFYSGKHSATA